MRKLPSYCKVEYGKYADLHFIRLADQIQNLGPATCFWAYPMERYIGTLKKMVSLMSNIDKDLSNRATTMEYLNHLPNRDPIAHSETANPHSEYPFAPSDSHAVLNGRIPASWEKLLTDLFGQFRGEFPDISSDGEEVVAWRKYHVKFDCTIGSVNSLGNNSNRRDDSYAWWTALGERRFGRVIVFLNVYDWEAMAVVREFRAVEERYSGLAAVTDEQYKAMVLIPVASIGGLVGRIKKRINGRIVVNLVGKWYEPTLMHQAM